MYSRKLHIPMVLGRIGTSSNSVESSNTGKNRKIKLYTTTLVRYSFDDVLSTHSSKSSFRRLISTSFCNTSYPLFLIIALAEFLSPLIYKISIISRLSYDYLRHRISIISYFSYIVSSLIRHLYKNLKSIYIIRDIFSRATNI